MKKYIIILSLLIFCIWSISSVVLTTQAQETSGEDAATKDAATIEEISQQEEVSYQELETEVPKLLPNNPFYFVKNWGRAVRRIFTFNPVKRAKLELEISDEQAAEIKRLKEIDSDNVKAIEKAADNYQKNIERLNSRLEALKEKSEDPNIDKLLDKLADRSLKHQRLFDNLKTKMEDRPGLKEKLEEAEERLDEVVVKIPEKFEDPAKFKERIQRIVKEQNPRRVFKELRVAEFVDRIEERLPESQRKHLKELKEEMISKFENKIESWEEEKKAELLKPDIIKRLPGDNLRRIKILEDIQDKIAKPAFRTEIRKIKEGLETSIDPEVGRERIARLIEEAKYLIAKAEKALFEKTTEEEQEKEDEKKEEGESLGEEDITFQPVKITLQLKTLLENAKRHLAQAEQALENNKLGEAFGEARSAISIAKNVLWRIEHIEHSGLITCPLMEPRCPAGKTRVKVGETPQGCPVLKCINCPQYTLPLCKENEKIVPRGKDVNGCPLPPKCAPEKSDANDSDDSAENSTGILPIIKPKPFRFCGGISGVKCPAGYVCKLNAHYPDAGGKCVKEKPKPICVQVITPAISPEGICKNFSTPCDVPINWKKVRRCPPLTATSTEASSTSAE